MSLFCALLGLSGAGTPVAKAHAQLLGSAPAANEELQVSPTQLRLWFNETVSPAGEALRLLDASGAALELGDIGHAGDSQTIRAAIPGVLPDGGYVALWAVVSADGHTIRGSFVFSVGEPVDGSVRSPAPVATPMWATVAAAASRSIAYVLAILLIGTLIFVVVPGRVEGSFKLRTLMLICASALLSALPAVLATEALVGTAGAAGDLWKQSTWQLLWDGRHIPAGTIIAGGTVLAMASLLAMQTSLGAARPSAMAAIILIALGFAWSGHPVADSPRWLGIAVNTIHVASAGAWGGALAILVVEGRIHRNPIARGAEARRFSRLAAVAFPVALVSGTYLAWRVLPGLGALGDTNYGRLLVAKVALLVMAGALASWNRWRILPRVDPAMGLARGLFGRFVAVELSLVVAVTVVTGSLTGQSPLPPTHPADERPPIESLATPVADGFIGPYHFVLEVTPAVQGQNTISLDLHAMAGEQVEEAPTVEVIFTHTSSDAGPFKVRLERSQSGQFQSSGQLFPLAGNWTMTLAIRVSEFDQERVTFDIGIR